MNYKNIALIALLLPIASYGNSTQARIKELKEAQFQKELEASNLFKMIMDKAESSSKYEEKAVDSMKLLTPEKDVSEIETSLKQLMKEFESELLRAKNLKQIFKDGILNCSDYSRVVLLIMVLEKRIGEKLITKYETCIEELIKINLELENLN
ncbi:MAG: hypothetical protein P4L31_01265 [Candidatus Babeliales bacterium]|nr:hypothetical protein [Candidatus Babeliales bacterium]